jgi:predicted transcriptional regulator of viral defense system
MRIDLLNKLAINGSMFTFDNAVKAFGMSRPIARVILSRLEKRGLVERIERGKYMLVPLGAEKGKFTVNEFVIGSLLVKPYAISYWSALHHYGFTEQAPATVFIQTTSRKKHQEMEIFKVRYRIVRIKDNKFYGIKKDWIEDTEIIITDKEKTLLDCLDKPQYSGGIIEPAKAIANQKLDINKLKDYARKFGNSGVIRRLGYLYARKGVDIGISVDTRNYLLLDPTMPPYGKKNARWKLIINLDLKWGLE